MTDDPKKPVTYSTIHGVERKPEPRTVKVDAAPSWAITMQEGINANHKVVLGQMQSMERRLDDLETWRKTGKHAAFVVAEGPQATTSGEVRRISQSDIAQNKAITGLSENQVALSDKVDEIGRKLEASDRRLDAQDKAIAAGTDAALAAKDNTVDIKKAVGGFMKQHPEISSGIATLLGLLIALATQWFQAKVHP